MDDITRLEDKHFFYLSSLDLENPLSTQRYALIFKCFVTYTQGCKNTNFVHQFSQKIHF